MMNGILRIQTYRPRQSAPVEGVTVVITGSGFTAHRITDAEGNAEDVAICAPACALSLDENNTTTLPYAVCSLTARKPGYRTVRIQGIQIFAGQVTLARPEMIPDTEEGKDIANPPVIIPTHALFAGNGGSGPAPTEHCTGSRVLDRVIVPKNITVHLGRPAASARNVTVSFRDYIANVASSEVYPTWPIEALKANIHCQISLALNRIYTEWYPSKGYTFNITNSTSYDQYYVHGRTVFDVMVKLTDDIFNTYIRKTGTVNPYYSEYCDGKSVTCPGLKQWGTVTLANQGRNALSILKYYYGSDIEIVRTSNIQSIPRSYPGSPLRRGDRGTAVFTLQRQLNRITKDYPFLGLLTVDGVFGSRMTETVKRFQKQFNLTADGVVGRQTWYKISYIYVSVKDLAELTSEGETAAGTLSDGTWGGTILRVGSSGSAVEQLQFWLNTLAQYESSIPSVAVDGVYGSGTAGAVRAFQRRYGLSVDGVVGRATWTELYDQFRSIQSDNGRPNAYPGTALRQGSSGQNVRLVQFWLKIARTVFDVMVKLTDDIFNTYIRKTGTVNPYYSEYCDGKSVTCPGLKQWGTVTLANQGRNALSILKYYYGSDIEIVRTSNIQSIPRSYPGSPLRRGDRGTAVFTLQRQLNRITKDYPFLGLLTVDGVFGSRMTETVKRFQKQFNLTADGVVGRQTWYKISYIYVSVKDLAELTSEGETAAGTLSDGTWGGTILRVGSSGSAVEQLQFWLNTLAQYESSIPSVAVDGVYGSGTAGAVRAFQRRYGLSVDGVVGRATWTELYDQFRSIQSDNGRPNAYPGTALRQGSSGQNVRLVQFWLKIARTVYPNLNTLTVDGKFGAGTAAAVRRFQSYFGLTSDGVVGRTTWNKLYEVYNDIANRLLTASLRPGEYPGVLRRGSTGTAVRELQFYLYLMSAYESSIPAVSIDGSFGAATENAVRAYQRFAKLTVDGVVGRTTWNSLYGKASILRVSGPVVTLKRLPYPGTPLAVGATGDAVLYYNLLLQRIAYYFDSVESPPLSDRYTDETAASTRSAQALLDLPETGVADAETWTAVEALSLQLAAVSPNPDRDAGQADVYPGRAMKEGSVGPDVGQIEQWLNGRYMRICGEDYVTENFRFGPKETEGVRAAQERADLLVTGTVNEETWAALRAQSCECEEG